MAGKRKPPQHPSNDHVDGIDTLSHERFNSRGSAAFMANKSVKALVR